MRLKVVSVLAALAALAWCAPFAQAGAIRYAGRQLHKGSMTAVQKTSDATEIAKGSMEDAGKATGAALKDGTSTLKKDATAAPSATVRQTKSAARKLWSAIW